jgi:ribonuclease HI
MTRHLQYWAKQEDDDIPSNTVITKFLYRPTQRDFTIDLEWNNNPTDPLDTNGIVPDDHIYVYTDGSKIGTHTGSGVAVYHKRHIVYKNAIRISDHASVFQAELYALQHAASYIQKNVGKHQTVQIYSDSQAALQAINQPIIKDTSTMKAFIEIQQAAHTTHNLSIHLVKAHVGIQGNEQADMLAKEATEEEWINDDSIPVPKSLIRTKLIDYIHRLWQNEWYDYKHATHTKHFYREPDGNLAKTIYYLSRNKLGLMIRMITGHNSLLYFRSKVDPENNDPKCRFCTEQAMEKFIHIITDCPRFAEWRREVFLDKIPVDEQRWDPDLLLKFAEHPDISSALDGYYDGVHYNDLYT